jgi:hypothetical protein
MAFCVRYYSSTSFDTLTDFLGFVEIEKATAEDLKTVFSRVHTKIKTEYSKFDWNWYGWCQ